MLTRKYIIFHIEFRNLYHPFSGVNRNGSGRETSMEPPPETFLASSNVNCRINMVPLTSDGTTPNFLSIKMGDLLGGTELIRIHQQFAQTLSTSWILRAQVKWSWRKEDWKKSNQKGRLRFLWAKITWFLKMNARCGKMSKLKRIRSILSLLMELCDPGMTIYYFDSLREGG